MRPTHCTVFGAGSKLRAILHSGSSNSQLPTSDRRSSQADYSAECELEPHATGRAFAQSRKRDNRPKAMSKLVGAEMSDAQKVYHALATL